MLENIPDHLPILYLIMIVLFLIYFWNMLRKAYQARLATMVVLGLVIWCGVVNFLASTDFFLDFDTQPPRFLLVFPPMMLLIAFVAFRYTTSLKQLDIVPLTFIHIIRIPVELFIHAWFIHELVPQEMTYEGRNFDILSGITALLVGFFLWRGGIKIHYRMVYAWNWLTLFLVINIVITAILALPSPFQQITPANIAVLHFPYITLPSLIVPIVIFCHVVSLIKLRDLKKELDN